ncbi:MAG: hypothetical protein JSW03_05300 [Candidatus Eiseniibacteriota bacterium]|nr:MAG: hypothetical protein JSW03_05300 [Candidatus Eisenbacteria bacterium]
MRKAVAILLTALFVVSMLAALSCAPKEEPAEEETTMEEAAPAMEEQPAEVAPADTAAAPEGE